MDFFIHWPHSISMRRLTMSTIVAIIQARSTRLFSRTCQCDRSKRKGAGLAGVGAIGPSAGRAARKDFSITLIRQARCLLAIVHAALCAGRWSEMTASGRYCCKSRKSDNPKNLAKSRSLDFLLLRRFSTPLRRSMIDFE
jgi:hypothetical protein